jgi:hypothetical protein
VVVTGAGQLLSVTHPEVVNEFICRRLRAVKVTDAVQIAIID